ncbi:MAG: FAD-dependent monooxygenase [Actinomycetota bacterium]
MSEEVAGPHDTIEVDVLIVGAGPVGLLGGVLAAEHGLRALVVERRDGPQRSPAAHVVNARTFEICRQAGLDMDRIANACQDPSEAGHVNFLTRLNGHLVGRMPFERQGDENLAVTPTPLRNLSQHRFEPILADELRSRSGAELRYGHRWEHSTPDADGVTSIITDLGSETPIEVRSNYVIGCDGAGSRVRKLLDIEMLGPPLIQCTLAINFAADLRWLIADRPGVLHFILDPAADGVFVQHDAADDWVFMHGIDPSTESVDDYDDARCLEVIRAAAGADIDATILGRGTWWMSAQTATSMGGGRLFLAGDAAHRFPPTGGLGLNSGVADIHGLLWRLRAIDAGWADPELLDSYDRERLPVARHNSDQSLTNAMKMLHLAEALGLDTEPTTDQLLRAVADESRVAAIAEAVELQEEHFDLVGLQLGYVYTDGAVVAEPACDEPPNARRYVPSARPGARLPHAWLDAAGGRSTLDLVDLSQPTLLSFGDHDAWEAAAADLSAHPPAADVPVVHVPVVHVRIGDGSPAPAGWQERCGVGSTGALLVRPDQHVAFRAVDVGGADGLASALRTVAGRD